MKAFAQRAYPRIHCEIPIQFASGHADGYEVSKMFNVSQGGFYFELSRPLQAESRIRIRTLNPIPESFAPEPYQIYIASIRWCREIPKPGPTEFGVGVRLLKKSPEVFQGAIPQPRATCALCGMAVPEEMLHILANDICFCACCYRHFQGIPAGRILESFNRFMIGNAL